MRLRAWERGWKPGNKAESLGMRLEGLAWERGWMAVLPGVHLCIALDVAVSSEWCRTALWMGTSWEVPVPVDAVQTSVLFSGPYKSGINGE